jgi:acetyltransferase-like isoleucine patch superfamily enzyme
MSEIRHYHRKTLAERKEYFTQLVREGSWKKCGKGFIHISVKLLTVSFTLGEGSTIGHECILTGRIDIGKYTAMGYRCIVASEEHEFCDPPEEPFMSQGARINPVVIGDDVWIGANVVITGGVTIHDHSMIGAGAVVTHDVPEWEIWGGVPAKKIGDRRTWKK